MEVADSGLSLLLLGKLCWRAPFAIELGQCERFKNIENHTIY